MHLYRTSPQERRSRDIDRWGGGEGAYRVTRPTRSEVRVTRGMPMCHRVTNKPSRPAVTAVHYVMQCWDTKRTKTCDRSLVDSVRLLVSPCHDEVVLPWAGRQQDISRILSSRVDLMRLNDDELTGKIKENQRKEVGSRCWLGIWDGS